MSFTDFYRLYYFFHINMHIFIIFTRTIRFKWFLSLDRVIAHASGKANVRFAGRKICRKNIATLPSKRFLHPPSIFELIRRQSRYFFQRDYFPYVSAGWFFGNSQSLFPSPCSCFPFRAERNSPEYKGFASSLEAIAPLQ